MCCLATWWNLCGSGFGFRGASPFGSAFGEFQAVVQPHSLVAVVALFFVFEQFASLFAVLSFEHFLGFLEEGHPAVAQSATLSGSGLFAEFFELLVFSASEQFVVE